MAWMFIAPYEYESLSDVPPGVGRLVDVPVFYYDGPIGDISYKDLPSMPNPTSDYFSSEGYENGYIGLKAGQTTANATEYIGIYGSSNSQWGVGFWVHGENGAGGSNASSIFVAPWTLAYHPQYGYLIIGKNNRGGSWDSDWGSLQPLYNGGAIPENAIYPITPISPPNEGGFCPTSFSIGLATGMALKGDMEVD